MKIYKPYGKRFYATMPAKYILIFRKNVFWQFLRFVVINLKMTIMLLKSHQKQ